MKIAICDDDKRICGILSEKIEALLPKAIVKEYYSGEEFLGEDGLPDILLLDIKMPGMDGMEVAKALREKGWKKILIFVTGEEDQVFDSFDVRAFHFLVKPIDDKKLEHVIKDAASQLREWEKILLKEDKYIDVQAGSSHFRINLSEVVYAEVFDRKVIIHKLQENIEYYGQLTELETLVGADFFRIHRSFLINMKYVERYDGTSATLRGGDNVPIARRNYPGFLKAYMEYSRRKG